MAQRRKIEVFTAGCPACAEAVQLVKFLAGTEHDIDIRDMHDAAVAAAASGYGIRRLPAIVIDGRLADRCAGRGLNEVTLTRAIFGGHGFTPSRHPGKPHWPRIG
jgi:glutaredoxin 3